METTITISKIKQKNNKTSYNYLLLLKPKLIKTPPSNNLKTVEILNVPLNVNLKKV